MVGKSERFIVLPFTTSAAGTFREWDFSIWNVGIPTGIFNKINS